MLRPEIRTREIRMLEFDSRPRGCFPLGQLRPDLSGLAHPGTRNAIWDAVGAQAWLPHRAVTSLYGSGQPLLDMPAFWKRRASIELPARVSPLPGCSQYQPTPATWT